MMKIESKEKLAKLLAVEDLDVQHRQVKTAMFDVQNRCIILPVWKDMPNHLYDLLLGHEVGHALFTPTDPARLKKINKETSKDCVNVIEDARIEKLVKNKYPGLRKQFYRGYDYLNKDDFFGVKDKIVNELPFLDRINLRFKLNQAVSVSFNDDEQKMVDKVVDVKTFADVEAVAKEIHQYIKDNELFEQGTPTDQPPTEYNDDDFPQSGEEGESAELQEDEDGEESEDEIDGEEEGEEDEDGEDDGDWEEKPKTEEEEMDEAFNKIKEDDEILIDEKMSDEPPEPNDDDDPVRAETQRNFAERIESFAHVDHKVHYITVPDNVNWKSAIVDYKEVHRNINEFYDSKDHIFWKTGGTYYNDASHKDLRDRVYGYARETLETIKKESGKNVNHIAMEFERKKAADVYKRTLVTKTGILDTNKMFSASYNDDVFKKNVRVADGKNHGLVMFVDWSGSMSENLYGTIRQLIELSMFCQKVNIPFEVYSFTERSVYNVDGDKVRKKEPIFKCKHGDLAVDRHVGLRNFLSSRMSKVEFNNALRNLCILANRYNYTRGGSYGSYNHNYPVPQEEELHGTPLNGAILLSEHIIRDFKKRNNLQNVNAVWLTDGEANGSTYEWDAEKMEGTYIRRQYDTLYLQDKKTKKNHIIGKSGGQHGLTPSLFDVVKSRLDINIVGFYIIPRFTPNALWRFSPRDYNKNNPAGKEKFRNWISEAKKAGFFVKTESGYDEYYVIQALNKNQAIGEIDEKMTTRKMSTLFSRQNSQFKSTRVILSRFVDLITA